jgi:hypothetical protein
LEVLLDLERQKDRNTKRKKARKTKRKPEGKTRKAGRQESRNATKPEKSGQPKVRVLTDSWTACGGIMHLPTL